ncbi:YesU protein [Byssothecium circinans]|uniref:YesU protein n=1 Tax=Byssothecium circinans TaxID=147558 RepID=A0A6A5TRV6_9PLEO|nr:YesU protein [Byssothecium circinans]
MRFSIHQSLLATISLLSTTTIAEHLLYRNTFNSTASISTWIPEGPLNASITNNTLELRGAGAPDDYFVYWLPESFPDRIRITWDFSPIQEPGLAMFFFGASSLVDGGSIFNASLAPRNGSYPQYHSGDIRTLHASYFRRRWPEERAFHLANLRKSPGFNLVAQGADPLPSVVDTGGAFYRVEVVKDGPEVTFKINGLVLFEWADGGDDDGTGPVVGGGSIGLRQMQPLVARYRNLEVWAL